VQRRSGGVPPQLADLPVIAERGDISDLDFLRGIGSRHAITGIVHLAGFDRSAAQKPAVEATRGTLDGLLNVVKVAQEWGGSTASVLPARSACMPDFPWRVR
jgi:UDP-glucose 4-epimerase